MRKKSRSLGYTNLLTNNGHAKKVVKMSMALPLLPQANIVEGLEAIEVYAEQNGLQDTMRQFLNYVRTTWVEGW